MDTKQRYKLEELLLQRQAAKQRQLQQLAAAQRAQSDAIAREVRAQETLAEAGAAHEQLRNDHSQRTGLTAAKLLARQQYVSRRQAELEELEHELRSVRQAAADARTTTDRAKQALAVAQAELEAIEKDKQRWQRRQRVAKQRLEEAELEDVLSGRQSREK